MTPTDGRDVAEAAVDLEGLDRQRIAATVYALHDTGRHYRGKPIEENRFYFTVSGCEHTSPAEREAMAERLRITLAATPPPSQPAEGEREAIARIVLRAMDGSIRSHEAADAILALRPPAQSQREALIAAVERGFAKGEADAQVFAAQPQIACGQPGEVVEALAKAARALADTCDAADAGNLNWQLDDAVTTVRTALAALTQGSSHD